LPYGGCYISGGLTPRFIDKLQDPDQIFMKTLLHDHMKSIIDTIPIYGVLTDELGERGAYVKAFQNE
jgi:glucokinase